MSQPLWYVRKHALSDAQGSAGEPAPEYTMYGPFPTPQVNEMLRLGELDLNDEVSLDRSLWQGIRDSGHFGARSDGHPHPSKQAIDPSWQDEREKARMRWLEGSDARDASEQQSTEMPPDRSMPSDHGMVNAPAHPRAHVADKAARATSGLIAVFAVLVVAMLGGVVWYGQENAEKAGKSIQAGLEMKASNCTRPAAPGVSWAGCNLSSASLVGANLSNANLKAAQLVATNLSGADLTYADLSQANLQRANLANATLLGANLNGADLSRSNLSGADLRYAVLTGATLEAADMTGASLVKATWPDGRVCAEGSIGVCR